MKHTFKNLAICAIAAVAITQTACDKNDNNPTPPQPVVYFEQQDQMARPAINTVFVDASEKDKFNTTVPSMQAAAFNDKFKAKLTAFGYTSNILGLDASGFAEVLSTDVLNTSTTAPTTFYDGTNVLTGRALADDVIDVELILIFGGAAGSSNPGLTSDHVDANDKAFLSSFPYLATPH